MTTVASTPASTDLPVARSDGPARAACLLGAVLAVAAVPVVGDTLGTGTGQQVSERIVDSAGRLQVAGILAVLAGSALLLAAVRLGQRLGGTAGLVAGSSGALVAMLLTAYYASFAAGALVGSMLLDDVGPGLAESTLVAVNVMEMTRFAPGLVLAVAAVVARDRLSKPYVWTAGLLAFLTVVPFTAWIAAIAMPVWLGAAGAARDRG